MLRESQTWDIRCPHFLLELFQNRRGYWFKVDRHIAQLICFALAKAYKVSMPVVDDVTPKGANGWYHPKGHRISTHARGHVKTVFHEFYHHLDEVTFGRYDSSDNPGRWRLTPARFRTGEISLAWQFAERLYSLMHYGLTHQREPGKETVTDAVRFYRNVIPKYPSLPMEVQARLITMYITRGRRALQRMTRQSMLVEARKILEESQQFISSTNDVDKTKERPMAKQSKKASNKAAESKAAEPTPKKSGAVIPLAFAKVEKVAEAKAVVKARTPAPPPAKKEPKTKNTGAVKSSVDDAKKITVLVKENPRNPETKAGKTFTLYKTGMTVADFRTLCKEKGGDAGYLPHDVKKGHIKLS